ncbi:MAG: hypothetical protein COT90_00885 [Candidatus Diapherotrites archaeon CG10_big_fil_rev_8_21_14_0_10_31_34]|nr:MAG: hypothetical protein COT90_00885 [Candidatus Diapherotrites archaeon CG10_big_fil_rev_8_21_14_0_10_31_34]
MVEINSIDSFIQTVLPELSTKGPDLAIFAVSIVIYGILIYQFYRFAAKRDVFGFDIEKYKKERTSFFSKLFNAVLGVFKYGVIFPFFVFIWFAGFSVLLFFMAAETMGVSDILMISVAFVGAIRIACYYSEDLAKDMAKLIPLALLGVAIVDVSFFKTARVYERIDSIPLFITEIATFFTFIVVLEWVLRILLSVKFMFFGINKREIVKEELREKIDEIVDGK